MTKGKDETVSVVYWVVAILITWIWPFGLIPALFLAFIGQNQTKKNFFRAFLGIQLAMLVLIALILGILYLMGWWPELQKQLEQPIH